MRIDIVLMLRVLLVGDDGGADAADGVYWVLVAKVTLVIMVVVVVMVCVLIS